MNPSGAQAFLARMLADPALLGEVRANPEAYAKHYALTIAEVRGLSGDGAPGVYMTAGISRWKKLAVVQESLPGTFSLCRTYLSEEDILTRCLMTTRMSTVEGVIEVIKRVGELAAENAADVEVPVVHDMVRYETLLQEMRMMASHSDAIQTVGPAVGVGVRVVTFRCPIVQVKQRLLRGMPYEDLRERCSYYVVARGAGTGVRGHVLRISRDLYTLLIHCDGTLSLHALAKRLQVSPESVQQALRKLRSNDVDIMCTELLGDGH